MVALPDDNERGLRGFQQLLVDAVDLAGSISPLLKAQLLSVLGSSFPAGISPTTREQKASVPAVLRMLMYARQEADRFSQLHKARKPLDICVAFLVNQSSDDFALTGKYH